MNIKINLILNKKRANFLILLCILCVSSEIISQNFTLKLISKNKIENLFLSKIDFKKNHVDTVSIYNEVNNIHKRIKSNGYLLSAINKIVQDKKIYTAFFELDQKIDSVILKHKNIPFKILQKFHLNDNEVKIPIRELENILNKITETYDKDGNSFSKIRLKNFTIRNKNLSAEIEITKSEKRKINKLIFKGYQNFPNSFTKNYFNIDNETLFNKKKLEEISKLSKNLDFVTEIKSPETLFTKDSTFVYVYLKRKKGSNFDGLINFSSNENGKLQFNGYLDLTLKNTLNTGESLKLLWNNFGNERQEFSLTTKIPYIFNSKISPELSFSLYKQDSTFLSTIFNSKMLYNLNSRTKLGITYISENSEKLSERQINNIKTFNNYFFGFQFEYSIPKNDFFYNDKLKINISPNFGKRNTEDNSSNQFKIETLLSYIWDINLRNSVSVRNKTGYLNSDNFIENELFRIGGANSIRGFNEQSIFTESYTYFNIEYRYLTSQKSYLYSILDLGKVKLQSKEENLLGIGLGYLFSSKNSIINLSTVLGKNTSQGFDIKNSKLLINWTNYF